MKILMQLHHDSSGVTLIEQLVALLLGTVVIASLYEFYRAELFRTISQEAKTSTLEDARGALDIIVRDLRNAGSWGTGSAPPERSG
jgi:Tfp pilus assembly protein PilW